MPRLSHLAIVEYAMKIDKNILDEPERIGRLVEKIQTNFSGMKRIETGLTAIKSNNPIVETTPDKKPETRK